jgi:hypothetical protein
MHQGRGWRDLQAREEHGKVDLQAVCGKALREPVQEPQRADNARGACAEAGGSAAVAVMAIALFGVLLMTLGGLIGLVAIAVWMTLWVGLITGDED